MIIIWNLAVWEVLLLPCYFYFILCLLYFLFRMVRDCTQFIFLLKACLSEIDQFLFLGLWNFMVFLCLYVKCRWIFVITDCCMLGMIGYDLLKEIKESSSLRYIPVVIMSFENVLSRINKCLEEGVEEFFLEACVHPIIDQQKQHYKPIITGGRPWKRRLHLWVCDWQIKDQDTRGLKLYYDNFFFWK